MDKENLELVKALRRELHTLAEPSMEEYRTKECIMNFLREHTSLEIVDRGSWFYLKKQGLISGAPIAFRADFDAVVCPDGLARHRCGHDGHSAILVGLALELENLETDRDVYLIFQPGEEVGKGGYLCAELMTEQEIKEVYGLHNIPGYREGEVLLLPHTFACASTGMEITLQGAASHAAYPDQGHNPAAVVASIIDFVEDEVAREHRGIVLGTVIGIELGSRSYGVSAGEGTVRLTLRAEYPEEYHALVDGIRQAAMERAREQGIVCQIRLIEEFPATVNDEACVTRVRKAAEELGMVCAFPREPFRWSEDFGYYLQKTRGAFFGLGCGIEHPGLHTEGYVFNDEIIEAGIALFEALI